MRKIYLPLIFTMLFISSLEAQETMECMPADTSMLDSIEIINPGPFNPDGPDGPSGGIPDTACAGQFYESTFTILLPESIELSGAEIPIQSISFATEGAISYEPALSDFDYVCNPPDCIFLPDSLGCVKIFGTPAVGEEGNHEVNFTGVVDLGFSVLEINFPDPTLAPGTYSVFVREENAVECKTNSTNQILSGFEIRNSPNPFRYQTDIFIEAERSGDYEFRVHDMLGKQLHRERVGIIEGQNTITFDGHDLAEGMYLFSLSDGRNVITKKMIVNR